MSHNSNSCNNQNEFDNVSNFNHNLKNFNNSNQPAGNVSLAEVENLVSKSIVSDSLTHAMPIDKNMNPNN